MPYPRPTRQDCPARNIGTGAGKELPLLNITLDADNRLRVSSAFGNVKCSAIKDILADAAEDFVNECYSKGDDEAVTIREFIALLEAAMISVCGPQVRKELLQNLATNVGYFEKTLQRVR